MNDVYVKFDEDIYKKIELITLGNYEKKGDFVSVEKLLCMIDDLIIECDSLTEKLQDLEKSIDNDFDAELEIPRIHGEGISW